ncbi:molybdopterin-synthase adenylyltransferase MoeB [Candidatus Halobeggiatoa sp. HSG11]|nr:molybdopterin-synthase adenylyltransferase MoeB [Candidatus Halobeggiatoa sp. HSG11]
MKDQLALKKVLIVGLGGLGSPVAMYLATAGVGHLVLVDFDRVDLSNLQRQIVHNTIGQYKVESAKDKLQQINPNIEITTYNQPIENLQSIINNIDVIVDCSDNFATRFTINSICVNNAIPLVSGAAIRWSGQVAVFLPDSPCYRCLYDDSEEQAETCSEAGILAPLVGIIGSVQAIEVIKILLGIGKSLCGKLLLFDAYKNSWRCVKLPKDPNCPVCSSNH